MIIDQLPLLSTDVQGTDEIPIERGTSTYKTTQAALVQSVAEKSLPSGGTTGQILAKADGTNYNTQWIDPPEPSAALYFKDVAISAMTGDFASVNDSAITADYVVAECDFSNPSAITTDVTWTTASGWLILNGTCTAATTANIVLVKS